MCRCVNNICACTDTTFFNYMRFVFYYSNCKGISDLLWNFGLATDGNIYKLQQQKSVIQNYVNMSSKHNGFCSIGLRHSGQFRLFESSCSKISIAHL